MNVQLLQLNLMFRDDRKTINIQHKDNVQHIRKLNFNFSFKIPHYQRLFKEKN